MKGRSAIDIVIIVLSLMVAATVILTVIGVLIIRIYRPEVDVKGASTVIADIIKTVVVALIGFVGGRAQGKMEANGGKV